MSLIPIDGRPLKAPWKQVRQATPTRKSKETKSRNDPNSAEGRKLMKPARTNLPSVENLQPAPIPPNNPWNRRRIIPSDDGNFPPLPCDHKKPLQREELLALTRSALSTSRAPSTRPRSSTVAGLVSATPCCSRGSLKALEAAAHLATENLWKHPFGADVIVQTPTLSFRVHRNTVTTESGWFRDNLPPPNLDGSPIMVHMDHAAEAIGHCLRYMYTRRASFVPWLEKAKNSFADGEVVGIELCEEDAEDPWDVKHLPRCVLAYLAAVSLHMGKMTAHLLQIVERTSSNLAESATRHLAQNLDDQEVYMFSFHVYNALDIIYQEETQKLMMPMRIALAGVADVTFTWLICRPIFLRLLSDKWSHLLPTLVLDQAEYRRDSGFDSQPSRGIVPTEVELEKLFADATNGTA